MDGNLRESIVSRMIFGQYVFELDRELYIFTSPTLEDKYHGQRIYDESYQYGLWAGMYSDEELLFLLEKNSFWLVEDEVLLKQLKEEIDNFKVKLFELTFNSNARGTIRKALKVAKDKFTELMRRKYYYSHMSASGYGLACKMRYLTLKRFHDIHGKRIDDAGVLIDRLISVSNRHTLSDFAIREIARNEPWRTVWTTSAKDATIFNLHPYELNEEQKSLLIWSMTYDSVYENSECPHDSVIEDDDMLDGWMIVQKRKREKEMNHKQGEEAIPDSVKNAQEIYMVVDNEEDAKKVETMNTFEARLAKKRRMAKLEHTDGPVHEGQMPDTRQKLAMEMARLGKEKIKGGPSS